MSDRDQSPGAGGEEQPKTEHLNIKVTDNNNEVFFKIKRTTALSKLMNAFCERQGKNLSTVRFLFDGARVNPTDSPDSVIRTTWLTLPFLLSSLIWQTAIPSKCTRSRSEDETIGYTARSRHHLKDSSGEHLEGFRSASTVS
ncbi:MAG: hypothetical protein Q9224_000445 [Gallowayella concinna]